MRIILSPLALLALAACSTGPAFQTQTAAVQTIGFPALHQVTTAPAHEAMIAYGKKGSTAKSLEVTHPTTFGVSEGEKKAIPFVGTCGRTIKQGSYPLAKVWDGKLPNFVPQGRYECYGPFNSQFTNADGGSSFLGGCFGNPDNLYVCTDETHYFASFVDFALIGRNIELKQSAANLAIVSSTTGMGSNTVKEFRYIKRNGNIFYFTYREYDDYPHHVVTEAQYQYDLSATNVIAFGNMRAQITNANDNQIEFTLLSNF